MPAQPGAKNPDETVRVASAGVSGSPRLAGPSQSVRTFTRRFRDEVGMSPTSWLTQQRIEKAQLLLEETDLAIDRIAMDVGFGSATSMRQHLHAAIGASPSSYRSTFRG